MPLDGGNLASCIESYFVNSEQLATRLWLASNGTMAGGLLLQQLPEQVVRDTDLRKDQWQHACTLAETIRARGAKAFVQAPFTEDLRSVNTSWS